MAASSEGVGLPDHVNVSFQLAPVSTDMQMEKCGMPLPCRSATRRLLVESSASKASSRSESRLPIRTSLPHSRVSTVGTGLREATLAYSEPKPMRIFRPIPVVAKVDRAYRHANGELTVVEFRY